MKYTVTFFSYDIGFETIMSDYDIDYVSSSDIDLIYNMTE